MQATELPLKDIHLPPAIGWWPPAIGWWLVALLVPLLIAGLWWMYNRLTRRGAIKSAQKLLLQLKQDNTQDNFAKLRQLSVLMRRVAISVYSRPATASITGDAWLTFLDNSLQGTEFTQGVGKHLAYAPFRKTPPSNLDMVNLIRLCERWFSVIAKQQK